MKMNSNLRGLCLILMVSFVLSCSPESSDYGSDSERSSPETASPEVTATNSIPQNCPQLTPEMVRSVCQISPELELKQATIRDCGSIVVPHSGWEQEIITFFIYEGEAIDVSDDQALRKSFSSYGHAIQELPDVDSKAFVTPTSPEDTLEETGVSYSLYFGTQFAPNKVVKLLLSSGDFELFNGKKYEGCSIEEGKELAKMLFEN